MAELKITLTLSGIPGSAVPVMALNKYNKPRWVAQQLDDGDFVGEQNMHDIWLANNHTFSDGCGNRKLCTAEIGVNIDTGAADKLSQLKSTISRGDISNHSAYHSQENPDLQAQVMDDEVLQVTGYKPSCFIIPTNYTGFANASYNLGYRGITSEGDYFDQFNSQRHHQLIPDSPILDYDAFIRDLRDDHDNQDTKNLFTSNIDMLFTGQRNFYIMATHSQLLTDAQKAGFKEIYDYLFSRANDTVLMCTVREFLDYRTMRSMPYSYTVSGNQVNIVINTDKLPERNRYRDVSFNLQSDQVISSVSVDGFDSYSFNPATGLVNAFKQKSVWSDIVIPPGPDPDPDQTLFVPYARFVV